MKMTVDYSTWMTTWEKEYTLTRQLYRNVLRHGGKTVLIDPFYEKTLTFRELDEESNRVANALLALGLDPFEVIMGNLMNTFHWFTVFYGVMKARLIFSTVNFRLPGGQIARLMDDSGPVVFFYDSEAEEYSLTALERVQTRPRLCIRIGAGDNSVPKGHISYDEFVSNHSFLPPERMGDIRWTDPCLILYTSGTTGLPKGFPINHAIIFFDNMMTSTLAKIDNASVNLATNPLFHRGGNTTGVLPCIHEGGSVVVMKHFSETKSLDLIERYGVSHMVSAPTVYERMCALQEKEPRDLSTLRRGSITSMGAPLEKGACLKMMELLTPNVLNGYGTADGHWVTMLRPHDLPQKAGTIGLSIPEDMVRLVKIYPDRRGNPDDPADLCPMDGKTQGEVALRTMHCPYQYIQRPEDTAKAFPYDGWQMPGDMATWDKDGYITICGRTDDMIISGGENVHPVIVEEALKEHPEVRDVMVTGVRSREWGELVVAYVASNDGPIAEKDLDRFCKDHPMLARYQRPRLYKFVPFEELPFNDSGKKLHHILKERAQSDFPNME
jgi:acyl-CoA synthetase (AMP-forming)/AMP-acid ligase II